MAAKLPMTVRKNIRDSEPDRDKNMAEISKVCGREMKFEPDFEYVLWLFFFLSFLPFHVIFPGFPVHSLQVFILNILQDKFQLVQGRETRENWRRLPQGIALCHP
jgi:hypothetical protein